MADTKKTETAAAAAPPKKKGKLVLFVVIGVVCLALGGGGAFFMLKNKPAEGDDAAAGTTGAAVKKKKVDNATPPIFYKFDKPFTVKLQTEQQEAYLQTEVQLKLKDSHGQDLMKQYEPELKHRMTLSLMSKKVSDLNTSAGVQRLADELRDVVNHVIEPPAPPKARPAAAAGPADAAEADGPVQSVLFSTFIIQ